MLFIKNLAAEVNAIPVLKGVNLDVRAGEVHAIMGPNGAGKSTLSKTIAGHPSYMATGGSVEYEINFKRHNLLELESWQRACEGVFMSFQYPLEIPGVSNFEFLRAAFNAVSKHQGAAEMDALEFKEFVEKKLHLLEMREDFLDRDLNVDFSGGEKKRNEILQMAVLSPRLALLDETDSGLDIDALKTVAKGIGKIRTKNTAIILVTHYHRILDYIHPNFVHIMKDGRIVKTGGVDLALQIERDGYDWLL